jgi:hypothetical protein
VVIDPTLHALMSTMHMHFAPERIVEGDWNNNKRQGLLQA